MLSVLGISLPSHYQNERFSNLHYTNVPEESRVHKFLDYVVKTYISEDSTYPPSVWASCDADEKRTTNCCESFHCHFGAQLYSSHPSIFDFLEQLKNKQ